MAPRIGDYMHYLIDYVDKNLKSGKSVDAIRYMLSREGYSRSAVEKALKVVQERRRQEIKPAPEPEPPKMEVVLEEEIPKPSLFSRIKGFFSRKKKEQEMPAEDQVNVDSEGNLV